MYLTIDIGGTNTRIGISNDHKTLSDIKRFSTPKSHEQIIELINDNIKSLSADKIIIGIAGTVDRDRKQILGTGNIEIYNGTFVTDLINTPIDKIYIENDAALAGLAESIIGACKTVKKMAYVTISTGVGGTLIENQELPKNNINFEPGHIFIEKPDFTSLEDDFEGSFEGLCGGLSFERKYGIKPDDCIDKTIWQEYGENLGYGLCDLCILWNPEYVVLGGSISKKAELFLETTIKILNKYRPPVMPDIKVSTLDDTNVMLGGLLRLNQV